MAYNPIVIGGGTEATAQRVTIATDSTGVLSVDDNGASLTVDAPVGTPVFTRLSDGSAALIGQKTMAASLPIVIASDQGALTVSSHAVTNAGTFAVQIDGAALTSLQLLDDSIYADDSAFTVAVSKVGAIGLMADETSTDSIDEGDVGIPRMTLDRKIIVTVEPHTAGGWDTFMASSADGSTALTSTAQAIKASAGKFGGYYIYNPNSVACYVLIYNVASGSVTVGTTNPKLCYTIPATSGANLEIVNGVTFDTAMAVSAVMTTAGGTTAPTTALEANFYYK